MDVRSPAWHQRDGNQPNAVHHRTRMRPDVMPGKPAMRGTRVTAEPVLRELAEGITPAGRLDANPGSDDRVAQRMVARQAARAHA
jgi:hypothetical protein